MHEYYTWLQKGRYQVHKCIKKIFFKALSVDITVNQQQRTALGNKNHIRQTSLNMIYHFCIQPDVPVSELMDKTICVKVEAIFGVPVLIILLAFYDLCGCDPRDVFTHLISNVYIHETSARKSFTLGFQPKQCFSRISRFYSWKRKYRRQFILNPRDFLKTLRNLEFFKC